MRCLSTWNEPIGRPYCSRTFAYSTVCSKITRQAPTVAAASILAKVPRDRIMAELDRLYPGYGFDRHKGYGTPEHQEALLALGPSPVHRKRFAPVAQAPLRFPEAP